jgi:hypothetical protein
MTWDVSHNAPRDRLVWLYLPAASYTTDERGHGTSVKPGVVLAHWNVKDSAWIMKGSNTHIYPSLWSDADPEGLKPDNPVI